MLRETLEAFAEGGWEAVKVDVIAERAGVHKTTIYRRWPTRGALITAALTATPFRTPGSMTPDTGTLRDDLRAFTDEVEAAWRQPRSRGIARHLAAASSEPEVAAAAAAFWSTRVDLAAAVVARAVERGELPRRTDPTLIATLLVGTVKFHVLDRDIDAPHAWYLGLVDAIVAAAAAPSYQAV